MNKIIILLFLFFGANEVCAQDYIFKVMANKGLNMAKTSMDDSWKPISSGDALQAGYWVKVVDKAYLGLVHSSGKTAALESPGEFKIESIESSIKNKKKGLGAKYTDFVFEQTDTNKELQTTTLSRGVAGKVIVELPVDAEVVHSKVYLRWRSVEENDEFVITVKGIFNDVLSQIHVKGFHTVLDLTDEALSEERTFLVFVSEEKDKSKRSADHVINRLNDEELAQMIPTPEEGDVSTAMDYVLLAAYYETNNLLIDASNFYQEAMLKSPDVEDFKKFYGDFLGRHQLE